ncbi:VRR-NUC domain-containing protein [Desulfosporosinus acidiphilus SJ4]|uniref:VRR-NUC domain-containing protein n=1 Tax=Desulfosporosinus acidiphilus (strain DSM 22704 / JCM 16185 / SJ4) TaxID=646529 RepID=I4D3D1_DESAJ|nr:VRR-NUC domain-containing protein [Desulfosporosinus acidiphilus]AFM40305.1 VRR-NUC domain-containing protein [Desulfosporosinus acidiphilus SJ4]
MTEAEFQKQVQEFLRRQGVWYVKYWGGGRFTKAGVPDLLCCVNGWFVGIELKTETGRVSKLQEYNLTKIQESGGQAFVLRPSGFKAFKEFIEGK